LSSDQTSSGSDKGNVGNVIQGLIGLVAIGALVIAGISLIHSDANQSTANTLTTRQDEAILSLNQGPTSHEQTAGGVAEYLVTLVLANAGGGSAVDVDFGMESSPGPIKSRLTACPNNPRHSYRAAAMTTVIGISGPSQTLPGTSTVPATDLPSGQQPETVLWVYANWTNFADQTTKATCYNPVTHQSIGGLLINGLPEKAFQSSGIQVPNAPLPSPSIPSRPILGSPPSQ
jgi:hypothetical protein